MVNSESITKISKLGPPKDPPPRKKEQKRIKACREFKKIGLNHLKNIFLEFLIKIERKMIKAVFANIRKMKRRRIQTTKEK